MLEWMTVVWESLRALWEYNKQYNGVLMVSLQAIRPLFQDGTYMYAVVR